MPTKSITISMCLLLLLGHGCDRKSRQQKIEFAFDKNRPEFPFVFIYRLPGFSPLPQEMIGGLVAAVWQDGRIVRAESEAKVGKSYVQGKLGDRQLAEIIQAIEESGILSSSIEDWMIVDARSELLTLRMSDTVLTWAKSPNLEASQQPAVRKVRKYLLELRPSGETPTEWSNEYPESWYEE